MKKTLDWKKYAEKIREMATGGAVLLKNDDSALPIKKGERVSVFGRIQLDYYNAGAGSGGMVNVPYVVSIPEGLSRGGDVILNEELLELYKSWEAEHPFDMGDGTWATEPFCQEEMPLDEDTVRRAADKSDIALIVIGRLAGEDKDAELKEGSYYLQSEEERMLSLVCSKFSRVAVLLNIGGIMDMSWIKKYDPAAVMILWQGGMEGGNAAADLLTGKVSPSGHLADTIAEDIKDYPAYRYYGDEKKNYYVEDIYVGYRYFESVAKDRVLYPFGFGLSYTSFDISFECLMHTDESGRGEFSDSFIHVSVVNTGNVPGREVVQAYIKAPQGALAKPELVLATFEKTGELAPGEEARMILRMKPERFASYDDGGYTGHKGCFVLEAGKYELYLGENVREAKKVSEFDIPQTQVVEEAWSAVMPTESFERMRYSADRGVMEYERVPQRDYDIRERIERLSPAPVSECTGDKGIKLSDVKHKRARMRDFLAQLSDEDLICISRMEGVYSPRAVDGTVGAFGGVTDALQGFGIPAACCTDGPSGIRRDDGSMAFSLPSGTLMACSFDLRLVEQLYRFEGLELRLNGVDTLLGPGINIHRYPLNGRNFEYFSEDPLLAGRMAAAQLWGMSAAKTTGTIKHFAANNQERARTRLDSVVSERALREIYLKPFEIAVKEGGAYSIMSTYGALNGTYTAGNFDLITTVLREQWDYEGLVMTDWWAMVTDELYDGSEAYEGVPDYRGEPTMKNSGPMIRAGNDLYSVHKNSEANTVGDNSREWLSAGLITRAQLVRNAENICEFILRSSLLDEEPLEIEEENRPYYDGKDKNRRIDEALQSPPPGTT